MWQAVVSPVLPNACGSAFVAKLGSSGTLSFLTYPPVAVTRPGDKPSVIDSTGNIWLTGVTSAPGLSFFDGCLRKISEHRLSVPSVRTWRRCRTTEPLPPFATPDWQLTFGQSTDIKIDSSNNVYVTGYASTVLTLPMCIHPIAGDIQPDLLQKWALVLQPMLQPSSTALTFPPTPFGGTSAAQTVTAQNTGTAPLELSVRLATRLFL